jgi:hypothetical protein
MAVVSHLPRNGRYELFSLREWTYCFDDPSFDKIKTPDGMFDWIRSHDPSLWHSMVDYPFENCALYLQPELYTIWKLKWAYLV